MRLNTRSVFPSALSSCQRTPSLLLALPVLLATATALDAASLTNLDQAAYKIEVRVGSQSSEHELAPGRTMSGFCELGCVIRLNGSPDKDYILEGTERVSIEGGLVYYDSEEVQPKEQAPDTAKEKAPE